MDRSFTENVSDDLHYPLMSVAPADDLIDKIWAAQAFEERYSVKILTQEARLLALVKKKPGQSLKFYSSSIGLSQRWFYITVEKLLKAGLIEKCNCEIDARSKTLR